MFDFDKLLLNPDLKEQIASDTEQEAIKCGRVKSVKVKAGETDGVVIVKFVDSDGAKQCQRLMNGRVYQGKMIAAFMWDGHTKYKDVYKESQEEQAKRLEQFGDELES